MNDTSHDPKVFLLIKFWLGSGFDSPSHFAKDLITEKERLETIQVQNSMGVKSKDSKIPKGVK